MPVDQVVDVEVVVVLPERVEHRFCDFEPPQVEQKLKEGKEREDHVPRVSVVEMLSTHEARQEEGVHCQRHHLRMRPRDIKTTSNANAIISLPKGSRSCSLEFVVI